jgi:hypothetical protein
VRCFLLLEHRVLDAKDTLTSSADVLYQSNHRALRKWFAVGVVWSGPQSSALRRFYIYPFRCDVLCAFFRDLISMRKQKKMCAGTRVRGQALYQ